MSKKTEKLKGLERFTGTNAEFTKYITEEFINPVVKEGASFKGVTSVRYKDYVVHTMLFTLPKDIDLDYLYQQGILIGTEELASWEYQKIEDTLIITYFYKVED